jgi:hypothetical protein
MLDSDRPIRYQDMYPPPQQRLSPGAGTVNPLDPAQIRFAEGVMRRAVGKERPGNITEIHPQQNMGRLIEVHVWAL